MTEFLYLAYGSNLLTARLAARVGPVRACGVATLPGYTLAWDKRGADGSGKCTLAWQRASHAHGVVFALATAALATLDRIEGVGRGYRGEWLQVDDFGRCYTYLADAAWRDAELLPYDWYHALVLAGAREHGLPAAWIADIARCPHRPDPDRVRAARHRALIDDMR